ncbi:MAG TPA: sugar transferase [Gaiellaceae bacterium]
MVAVVGRALAVVVPVYGVLLTTPLPTQREAFVFVVSSAVWFGAITKTLIATRSTRFAVGPAFAAVVGAFAGVVVLSAIAKWLPLGVDVPMLLLMSVGVFAFGWAWERIVVRSIAGRPRVLIVGEDEEAHGLAHDILADPVRQFEIAALVLTDEHAVLGPLVEEERPDIVVLAMHELRGEAVECLLDAATAGFRVVGVAEFHEHAFGRVPVDHVRAPWFVNVLHLYHRPYSLLTKRLFDVVVASFALVATSWLFPILWLAVRRTPGPVLFRQVRLGEGGKPFRIYKFRTMRADAEPAGAQWASRDDPRVTPAGKLMRKTRLDELPQLVNVLKGEMSIVGPRPERPEFMAELRQAVPFWTRRHLVKPGITGWAQVRHGYTDDASGTADKLSYDLWYLRHRSLLIDLAICVKTIRTLVTGTGAR